MLLLANYQAYIYTNKECGYLKNGYLKYLQIFGNKQPEIKQPQIKQPTKNALNVIYENSN